MLTLTFLGVGSAFAKRNFQANALIEAWSAGVDEQVEPDDTLLVDFGTTGPLALHRLKDRSGFSYLSRDGLIRYSAVRRIFVTHLHSDHIGGLEELAVMSKHRCADADAGETFRPQLIAASTIIEPLWEHALRGGLGITSGREASMDSYFNVSPLKPTGQGGFDHFALLGRYDFGVLPTDHIRIHRRYDWPSYGLKITDTANGRTALFTSDTRFDPEGLGRIMAEATVTFHDVQLHEHAGAVHALIGELRTLPEATRKKTILYHYGDTWDNGEFDFVGEEFAGFAEPQRRYTLFD